MQNLQILNFGHLKMGIANRAEFMEGTAIKRDLQAAAKVNWTPLSYTSPCSHGFNGTARGRAGKFLFCYSLQHRLSARLPYSQPGRPPKR